MTDFQIKKIAIIGQGYVGLPLAIAFSDFFPVIGFDINKTSNGVPKMNSSLRCVRYQRNIRSKTRRRSLVG